MTTLSASDIAALRIREARTKRGWTVKDLARRCTDAGVPGTTAAVITNLETRRRPGRKITAEELLALAWVLDVPPMQLLLPLKAGEELRVVPGEDQDPLQAVSWLSDDAAASRPVRILSRRAEDIERILQRTSPLTVLRQIRMVTRDIRLHDRGIGPDSPTERQNMITVLALRLAHLLGVLETYGGRAPELEETREILGRHGLPLTPEEWG